MQHGAYKIWHRNVEPLLREAYDSIYGLALYGSLVFATVRTPMGCIVIKQEVCAGFGCHDAPRVSDWCASQGT